MRGPWWEQTPHSCWHWGCLGTTHTVWEAAPTYLAVLLGPGATGNLATPDPSKMIGSSSEDGSQHSRRQGLEMNMEQREMRRKKKKKILWLLCQNQQWMEKSFNLLVWKKGPSRWRIFFFCSEFELCPDLIFDLYFTLFFFSCCCFWLFNFLRNKIKPNRKWEQMTTLQVIIKIL